MVLHLSQNIPSSKRYQLYFDNWFNTLPLQVFLAKRQIWSCGTIQTRRLPGLNFTKDTALKQKESGSYDKWDTYVNGERVTAVKWFNSRAVHTLSTFATALPTVSKERHDHAKKEKIRVECLSIVH